MSRVSKVLLLLFPVVFVPACNFAARPLEDVQNIASTTESIVTAIPVGTFQTLPSAMTDIEVPSAVPDIGDMTNPQGEPLSEWNGIPIMSAATTGEESTDLYSFKVDATVADVFDYYKAEMENLGWTESFTIPDTGNGALLTYEKDDHLVTITITSNEIVTLVLLTHQ